MSKKDGKKFRTAARRIIFLCNELADEGMIPRTFEVEEILRDVWDDFDD